MRNAAIINRTVLLLTTSVAACLLLTGAMPVNEENTEQAVLFTLGRSPDPNEIIYEINRNEDGTIDPNDPVKEYWLRHTEGDIAQPLTWAQQHFGFGMKLDEAADSIFTCHFAAYKKRKLTLRPFKGKIKAFIKSGGKHMILDRVFLQVEGGSFWFPNITQATLYLTDPQTCQPATEIIIP